MITTLLRLRRVKKRQGAMQRLLMSMPNKYAYLNAKIRALISGMLSAGDYEKILQAETFEESTRLLTTIVTGGELIEALTKPQVELFEVDQALTKIFVKTFKMICEFSPRQSRPFLETYFKKVDFDCLKTVIRSIHNKTPKEEALRFIIATSEKTRNEFTKLLETQSVAQLIEEVQIRILKEALVNALPLYESTRSTVPLESTVDKVLYKLLWDQIRKLGSADRISAKELVGTRIDLNNILVALRSRELNLSVSALELLMIPVSYRLRFSLDEITKTRNVGELLNIFGATAYKEITQQARELYEREPDITQIESLVDRYVAHQSFKQFAGYSFHIGIAVAYLNLKFYELRNIKASVIGKYENIPVQRIRNILTFF
jgi:vacuolar-type H+-ATPase subunit C/Vma6